MGRKNGLSGVKGLIVEIKNVVTGCYSWRARRYKSDRDPGGTHTLSLENDEEWHRPEVFMGLRTAA